MKGQLDKAIKQYERVLFDLDGKPQLADELALFNKLGDLYVKQGNSTAAVDQYEKAIDLYAEQGFPNNAIALCNKVLRNAPGRTHIYLKLAKLMMQRGFASEAKQNLLEYAERMQKAGKLEEAFHALKEFADLSPDKEEIRLILADQLKKADRGDEAHEQLEKLYQELQDEGDANRTRATLEKMRAIDPEYDLDAATPVATPTPKKKKSTDIVFLDLDEDVAPATPAEIPEEVEPLDVEATSMEADVAELAETEVDVGLGFESGAVDQQIDDESEAIAPVEGLDVAEEFEGSAEPVEALDIESTSLDDELDVPEIEPVEEIPDIEVPIPGDDIEVAEVEDAEEKMAESTETAALDDLPLIEVPSSEGDVESVGADETTDIPALEVPAPDEEDVDEIEVEVPWDVDDAESVAEVPEQGTPVFADDIDLDEVDLELPEVAEIAGPDISSLEAAVADDPDKPDLHRELAEALIETGDRERGMEELDIALQIYQADGEIRRARDVLDEILRLNPNSVDHHQKRVEFVTAEGDRSALTSAYLDLADALLRSEQLDRARSVYERVLETDPGNESAKIALDTLMPEPTAVAEPEMPEVAEQEPVAVEWEEAEEAEAEEPEELGVEEEPELVEEAMEISSEEAPAVAEVEEIVAAEEIEIEAVETPPAVEPEAPEEPEAVEPEAPEPVAASARDSGGFVDLGALIMDEEETVKDTRMRIDREDPVEEEEHAFAEMLSEFKKGIDANIDADDSQAHYDLGVAFKEMGLLDEAISEFQKALRGSEDRLRTSESLGLCFYEKGQFAVAATVLRRAVESERGGDEEKIGLLYWLGRCEEEQGRNREALGYYQRIFSIDINFHDVGDRVNALSQAGG